MLGMPREAAQWLGRESGTQGEAGDSRVQAGADVPLEVTCPTLHVTTHAAWLIPQESSFLTD